METDLKSFLSVDTRGLAAMSVVFCLTLSLCFPTVEV